MKEEKEKLTNKEIGQILAALRYWQTGSCTFEIECIADEFGELTTEEIDDLCEKLNFSVVEH